MKYKNKNMNYKEKQNQGPELIVTSAAPQTLLQNCFSYFKSLQSFWQPCLGIFFCHFGYFCSHFVAVLQTFGSNIGYFCSHFGYYVVIFVDILGISVVIFVLQSFWFPQQSFWQPFWGIFFGILGIFGVMFVVNWGIMQLFLQIFWVFLQSF